MIELEKVSRASSDRASSRGQALAYELLGSYP